MPDCDDENLECQEARADYDSAKKLREEDVEQIKKLIQEEKQAEKDRNTSGGVAVVGVAIAWGAGWTGVGALLGGAMVVVGVLVGGHSHGKLDGIRTLLADARKSCEEYSQKMQDA